ncbi:hypothetical protein LTS17_008193 [Exophiala oligosperma]
MLDMQETPNQGKWTTRVAIAGSLLADHEECDEQTPTCQNCVKHGAKCTYTLLVSPQADRDLRKKVHLNWFPNLDSNLFNYFIESVVKTMMPLSSWGMAAQNVVYIAVEEPLAMHSVLAASGCHYRYHLKSPRDRCLSETYHSMQACSGLRRCLEMQQVDKVDAAITTSMFLGSISFADLEDDFQVPLKDRRKPFSWLGSQLGLGSILTLFKSKSNVQDSMWINTLEPTAETVLHLLDDGLPGTAATDGLPDEFATIFGVCETSGPLTNSHHKVLRRLCRLLPIVPENEVALLQYMQFVEVISSQFLHLLNSLDTRALLLVSYWLALLCAEDCWWTRRRAQNDCWAICEHIEQTGDKSLWRYMDFPAAACGYPYTGDAPAGQRLVEWFRGDQLQSSDLYPASTSSNDPGKDLASNLLAAK